MVQLDFGATARLTIPNVKGAFKEIWGGFKSGSRATGYTGTITTGLKEVHILTLTETHINSTAANLPASQWVVTTLPALDPITIVGGTAKFGDWHATGV